MSPLFQKLKSKTWAGYLYIDLNEKEKFSFLDKHKGLYISIQATKDVTDSNIITNTSSITEKLIDNTVYYLLDVREKYESEEELAAFMDLVKSFNKPFKISLITEDPFNLDYPLLAKIENNFVIIVELYDDQLRYLNFIPTKREKFDEIVKQQEEAGDIKVVSITRI